MRVLTVGIALVALVGCKNEVEPTDDPVIDDTDDDIPDTFLGRTFKPADVERDGQSLRAGLIAVTVEADGSWTLGAFLGGSRLTGTGNFGVELPPTAPAADVRDLPGDRRGALYLPLVYDDTDLDEVYTDNDDDFVLGVASDRWLVYLETPAGGEAAGWGVVDPTGEAWTLYRLTEQAAVQLYGLTARARLQGIYEGTRTGIGVIAVDERWPGDGIDPWTPLDVAVNPENGQFDQTVDSRPPVGAFQFPEGGVRYVRAPLRFYEDTDASGDFDPETDQILDRGLCYDGSPLVLRFSDTPRTVSLARQIAALEWTTGWRFVTGAYGDSTEIERGDLQWARFSDDCGL